MTGCHHCGLLQRLPEMPTGGKAVCGRCRSVLHRYHPRTADHALALALAGVILFIVSNSFPFLMLELKGQVTRITLLSGVRELFAQGMPLLAILVFCTSILAPGLLLLILLSVLAPLRFGAVPPYVPALARLIPPLLPWVMVEVFILSILVALVKLAGMATVVLGAALWALAALMVVLSAAMARLDLHTLWERISPASAHGRPDPASRPISCATCGLLNAPDRRGGTPLRCRRCGARLHRRKPHSLQRTWALVAAALICYAPANLLPVMISGYGGWYRSDTILEGVVYMLFHGNWPLAVIIFVASILVPLTKILILIYLLITVRLGSARRPVDRTRLYRVTEVIGKWSMVDIFVVTIMTGLVQLGNWGIVRPAPGAIFFGAVVVITMAAAMSFDPRLIWDAAEKNHAPVG